MLISGLRFGSVESSNISLQMLVDFVSGGLSEDSEDIAVSQKIGRFDADIVYII